MKSLTKYTLISLLFGMLFASEFSLGVHESLGFMPGTIAKNHNIEKWSSDYNKVYFSTGTFLIPIVFSGGVSITYKRYVKINKRMSPFMSFGLSQAYINGWCQTEGCTNKSSSYTFISSTLGWELYAFDFINRKFKLQFGVQSKYNLTEGAFIESASDKPWIHPLVNLKISKLS